MRVMGMTDETMGTLLLPVESVVRPTPTRPIGDGDV